MEELVNLFTTCFAIFSKQYIKEDILYSAVSPTNVSRSSTNTKYIASKIQEGIATLERKATVGNITIFYKRKPAYYIEFLVFYIRWIEYILNSIRREVRDVNIIVYLTGFKKAFPKSGMLTPFHVNSGVTLSHSPFPPIPKTVIVFREEEVFKVLMHEMIHAYDIDSVHLNESLEVPFKNYFGRKVPLRLNESLTDTLACIYNVLSFSLFLTKVKGGNVFQTFMKYLQRERLYILEKSRDVLTYEGYIFNGSGIIKKGVNDERTHVLSYYVLKALNFYYIDHFMNFIASQGFSLKDDSQYVYNLLNYLTRRPYWSYLSSKGNKRFSQSLKMSDVDIKLLLYYGKDKLLKTIVL